MFTDLLQKNQRYKSHTNYKKNYEFYQAIESLFEGSEFQHPFIFNNKLGIMFIIIRSSIIIIFTINH